MEAEPLINASYKRVLERKVDGQGFFSAFYENFIDASPDVAAKFRHTDMPQQQSMLKKAFYHLLAFYGSNNADYYLHQVAISHNRTHLDISPELHEIWLEILIDTVRCFDECFDAETELAWRLVMAPGIVYMKFHYDRDAGDA